MICAHHDELRGTPIVYLRLHLRSWYDASQPHIVSESVVSKECLCQSAILPSWRSMSSTELPTRRIGFGSASARV